MSGLAFAPALFSRVNHRLVPSPHSIFLVDNGSLESAATLQLRAIAAKLSAASEREIEPVSLLHSSAVPAEQLCGIKAEILEPALEQRLQRGSFDFLIVPLFFGPSGALTDYLPKRIAALKRKHPQLSVRIAPPLVDSTRTDDERVAAMVEDRVLHALPSPHESPAAVVLVDHGSPAPAVTAVRDLVARQLRVRLASRVRGVLAASMERRAGAEYDFNEPLLEHALRQPGFNEGSIIVAPLFLSPGRHAGPGGDIAQICAAAQAAAPRLRIQIADLVGSHPQLIPLLVDRLCEGLNRSAV